MLNNYAATGVKLGGLSRSKVFELWASGELQSVTVGSRRFSSDDQIANYIRNLELAARAVTA